MPRVNFAGCSILLVEDEPSIALHIAACFESACARVLRARGVQEALCIVENRRVSAALLDSRLSEGAALCERLAEHGIPVVVYSGYRELHAACREGVIASVPANPQFLLTTVADLLV
jgi:DNA-binding NtrC family response regulator